MDHVLLRFPNFRDKAVTLSYDDDVVANKRLLSIMQKYGIKGTFNLNSEFFKDDPSSFTKEDAKELILGSGNEIAVHGAKHLSLAEVDLAVGMNDILTDRKELEKLTGAPVKGMAYANGSLSDDVVKMLEMCGIVYARTTRSSGNFLIPDDWLRLSPTCHHDDPRLPELVKSFLETPQSPYVWGKSPRLFYLWGHAYEFDNNKNWNVIESFAEKVGGREDVWYATNMEIYTYVRAFHRLEFTADGTKAFNPSATDVYLDYLGKQVLVKAGQVANIQ